MLRAKRKTNNFYLEGKNMAKSQIEKLEQQYDTCPYRYNDMGCYYCDYKDRDLAQ
jgi:hypothetical protein